MLRIFYSGAGCVLPVDTRKYYRYDYISSINFTILTNYQRTEMSTIGKFKDFLKNLGADGMQTPPSAITFEDAAVNEDLTNPQLKELFTQWKGQSGYNQSTQLLEEIAMRARFLSAVAPPKDGEPADAAAGSDVTFQMLFTQDSKQYYPAFTDRDELAKWDLVSADTRTLTLTFDDYAAMVPQNPKADGVVINPFGECFVLDKKMLRHMLAQKNYAIRKITPWAANDGKR